MQIWIDQLSDIHPTYPLLTSTSKFPHTIPPSQSLATLKSEILKRSKKACLLGIPLIGKTTLLNTLLSTKSRIRPTTSLKSHELSSKTTIIDTPGIPLDPHPLLALLGLGKPTQETILHLIHALDQLPKEYYSQLETVYGIPALIRPIEGNRFIDPAKDLLVHVARKFARMGKSGPNLEGAAEVVGGDALKGKIQWWLAPRKQK
jgi:ribosome biogenesis GTPase A